MIRLKRFLLLSRDARYARGDVLWMTPAPCLKLMQLAAKVSLGGTQTGECACTDVWH